MDSLIFAQINAHHCKAAMANLSLYTHENKVDILIIQESYCYMEEPRYIPPDYLAIFAQSSRNPRATLLIKRGKIHNFMFLHQFSNLENSIVVTTQTPQFIYPALTSSPTTLSTRTSHTWSFFSPR
jgi:hypothetical protein